MPESVLPSMLKVANPDHFRAYFVSKLAQVAHGPDVIRVEEYRGPSLVAKSEKDNETFVCMYHGPSVCHTLDSKIVCP